MDDAKELTAKLAKMAELLKATEDDRDHWKERAQKAEESISVLRHTIREALETSE